MAISITVLVSSRDFHVSPGACTYPRLQYTRDYGVLPLLIAPILEYLYVTLSVTFVLTYFIFVVSVFA